MDMMQLEGFPVGEIVDTWTILSSEEFAGMAKPNSVAVYHDRVYMTEGVNDSLVQFIIVDGVPQVCNVWTS